MRSIHVLILALAMGSSVQNSWAEGSWRVGSGGDGEVNAALFASNALTTGSRAIDFHPVLTISCLANRDPQWRQAIRVREPLSGRDGVDVGVRIDNAGEVRERWSLAQKNRALVADGSLGVSRLTGARQLRVSWRIGLFSGDGEAVFNLAGIDDAIAAVADKCGVAAPVR